MQEKKLYSTLLDMLHAAEKKDASKVAELNRQFIPEYNRVMPKQYKSGSLPDIYDTARNKIINSINDVLFSPEEKKEELEEAKRIISRIVEPED